MSQPAISSDALAGAPVATIPAGLKDYIAIARPDNWAKNVFMLPGVLFAFIVYRTPLDAAFFTRAVSTSVYMIATVAKPVFSVVLTYPLGGCAD
ncbi:MAG: hypothetical protein ACRYG7_19665, partial [Janthinobacterium lividum]